MARKIVVAASCLCLLLPTAARATLADGDIYRVTKIFDRAGKLLSEDVDGEPWVEGPRGEKEFLFDSTVGPGR
jgi:hypothetical protein